MEENIKKGTTTVGIICKDGVVLAAEKKSVMGHMIDSKEARKVYQIDNHIAMTIAGSAGDAGTVVRILKAQLKLYKLERGPIAVKSAATLLSNILQENRWYPFMTQLILAGYDSEPRLYSIDAIGGYDTLDKFYSSGSGSPMAYGVLEAQYKENLTTEEGIKLAIRAIKSSIERDVFSGGRGFTVAVISKDGYKELGAQDLKQYL